jgi:hypothetical protein
MAWNNSPIVADSVCNNSETAYWQEVCDCRRGSMVIHHSGGGFRPYGSNEHGGQALVSIFDGARWRKVNIKAAPWNHVFYCNKPERWEATGQLQQWLEKTVCGRTLTWTKDGFTT